ncbi:MAG: aminopeptidase P family protein [Bacteroidota bacterium]
MKKISLNEKKHGPNTRYGAINRALFTGNRARLESHLPAGWLVVVQSNDLLPTNGDGTMPFHQNSDFFYLTGIDQEETVLLLYYEGGSYHPILFITETTPKKAVWEGPKYTYDEAREASGIDEVRPLSDFQALFGELMEGAKGVYVNTNEYPQAQAEVIGRGSRFMAWCRTHYPKKPSRSLKEAMTSLRMIKSPLEIDLIRRACQITAHAFKEVAPQVRPNMYEYEIEALFSASILRQGSDGFAYAPIIASGKNSCTLHYTANNQIGKQGDVLLLDVGARYSRYASDVTRVLPIGGAFTERQKDVYQAVHRIMEEAKKCLVIGRTLRAYHREVGQIIQEELLKLGVLTQAMIEKQDPQRPAYQKYCMHGISHHLGLDTHDLADPKAPLAPGMVLTVEPGIYLPEEGFGIRLEDDILLREEGLEVLTEEIAL